MAENLRREFHFNLAAPERPSYIAEVREVLRPELCDAGGKWTADYVRLRFGANKRG